MFGIGEIKDGLIVRFIPVEPSKNEDDVVEFTRKHTGNVGDSLVEIRRIIDGLVAKRDARKDEFAKVIAKAMQKSVGDVRQFLLASNADNVRWPTDEQFRSAWLTVPVYSSLVRARVRMLLEALEIRLHTGKTEKIEFGEKLTIEHLLPQTWQPNWPLPDGQPALEAELDREKVIHTIGNLTLLTKKLNPSVSNGAWATKLPAILEHSALSLNRKLQSIDEWNEKRITERSEALFDVACQLWPRPDKD